jgi:hypothetical protein
VVFAIGHDAIARVSVPAGDTRSGLEAPRLATINPDDAVVLLNQVFSALDEMAERDGLGKIKRRGNASMAASGLPEPGTGRAQVRRCDGARHAGGAGVA